MIWRSLVIGEPFLPKGVLWELSDAEGEPTTDFFRWLSITESAPGAPPGPDVPGSKYMFGT